MPFVKLDCGILDSTLWLDRDSRECFLTALLMAQPCEFSEPAAELEVRALNPTGYEAPPGWYGFVPAAGVAIIRRAGITDQERGLVALERLSSPEAESRSPEFEGRRMIRVDGGYLILNFMKYRDRDYTGAERAKRYRDRQKASPSHRDDTQSHRDTPVTSRMQSAESEEESEKSKRGSGGVRAPRARRVPPEFVPDLDLARREIPDIDAEREAQKFRDHEFKNPRSDWAAVWRTWVSTCRDTKRYARKEEPQWR